MFVRNWDIPIFVFIREICRLVEDVVSVDNKYSLPRVNDFSMGIILYEILSIVDAVGN